jgi:signal transduction histidine kinase
MMSHEIRTPLNSIIGLSDILIKENPREDQLDTLKMLDFSARNLLKLLNDILDLNKLGSGKLILENEPFEIVNFLDQLQQTYAFQASQKGLEFHYEIDPATPAKVLGDPIRLAQILNNLFSNAIKFTDTGFIALNVKVRSYKNGSVHLRFNFSDSGMGIPKEKQQIIFQDFTQASQDTFRKYGGTGLGLSIIKNLLEYMGSSIELYSENGKGSTFTFDLTFECPEDQNCGKRKIQRQIKLTTYW